jgi:hypothetical protein
MKRSGLLISAVVLLGLILMPGKSAVAQDEITASQFKELIVLLSHIEHGKTTLVAVQGNQTIEVTEFALMKQLSASGIKTTFYLRDDKTGVRKLIAAYESSQTTKSMSRKFWGLICSSSGLCQSCTQLFGDNPCK